ncbi:MAG: N-acetylglucosamine repressor [Bryobacteraceae bacterium]|nr:N-acetylglucosamine repressor [Bryobacteraceae bacterium]
MKRVNGKAERDLHIVEAVVRRHGPISRARIHELTGIRPSATSQLVRRLLKEGRLLEAGVEEGRLGRKGVLLELNEAYASALGIEFDDETVTAGVTDLHPRIRHKVTARTLLEEGTEGLIRQLLDVARRAIREAAVPAASLVGIGVADPGLVDSQRGVTVTSSTMPFWKQVPLKEIFEREFNTPVQVETRTRAKAVAEHEEDLADGAGSMVYVDYGSGIGAGLYVDGRLLYGQGSAAGEFGHTHVTEDGPICNCGSFGCLEAFAGIRAVEARLRRIIAEGGQTDVLDMADGDPARITGWMVFQAASRGDKAASSIVAEVGRYLALGIANLVNLFNPGVVVLDATLGEAGQELLEQISGIVRRKALRESAAQAVIRYARVRESAGVLGVARIALAKHFEIPAFKPPPFLLEERGYGK